MAVREGIIDPHLDVQGAFDAVNTRDLTDEANERGVQDGSQATGNGTSDNITAPVSNVQTATVAGASFTASMVGKFVTVASATNPANNGTFPVTAQGGTTISYVNASGVVEANTSATFDVYAPYMISDDVAFIQTDRKNIKGTTNHYDDVPTYERPTAVGTTVPANLTNIASKTTDAKALVSTRKFENQTVAEGNLVVTLTDTGNMQHADAVDTTGIPIQDGADAANLASCYTEIIDPSTGQAMVALGYAVGSIDCDNTGSTVVPADTETVVLNDGTNPAVTFEFDTNASVVETATLRAVDISSAADDDDVRDALITAINGAPTLDITASSGGAGIVSLANDTPGTAGNVAITETVAGATFVVSGMSGGTAVGGQRIYAFTQAGSSTEPNSVEAKFYTIPLGDPISTANPYTWERDLPTTVDIYYGYRERLDNTDENAFRTTLVHGIVGDPGIAQGLSDLQDATGIPDDTTNIGGLITNTGNYFPFSELGVDPTVIDALNKLNEEVGNRDYSAGAIANVSGLADGQTITASIEALANAIGASNVTRVIERLTSTVPKNTAHTLPGANSYTLDATDNGLNMWVYWRKQLRDPGPNTIQSNDYEETSTTSITPYEQIKSGDSINYFILQ
jgi:hypothetical protein